MIHNKLAIVIATKDRPKELKGLLSNLEDQSVKADQILVVDGSDAPINEVVEGFFGLKIDYLTVRPPALTKQKNAGVRGVRSEIDIVGFIDDDVRLEEGALEAMMAFWQQAPEDLAGASFNITDFSRPWSRLKSLPQRFFFIDSREFGHVLRSGFNTPIYNAQDNTGVEWLGGGFTIWRKQVFNQWQFDEWFEGSGLWEDVHFSHMVAQKHQLAVVAGAKASHLEGPVSPQTQVRLGRTQIVNWIYFVRSNSDLSFSRCIWACIGRTSSNLAKGVFRLDLGFVLRALGNTIGIVRGITMPAPTIGKNRR